MGEGEREEGEREVGERFALEARDHGLTGMSARKARAALGPDATLEDAIAWKDRGGR